MAALATIVGLLAAMFVALPASAQTTTYYCTQIDFGDSPPANLRITDKAGEKGYILTEANALSATNPAETTLDLTAAVDDSHADACGEVDSDVNVADDNGEDAVDGDALQIGLDDKGNEDATDDTREWFRVYKEALGNASSTETNNLLTDNPANPKKGADRTAAPIDADTLNNDPRPQTYTIPGLTGDFAAADDEIENTDTSESIIALTGDGTAATGWTVTAVGAGTATVTITDDRGALPSIVRTYVFMVENKVAEAQAAAADTSPSLKVSFNDSDGTVEAGTDVKVTITKGGTASLESVTISGGLHFYGADDDGELADENLIGPRAGNVTTLYIVVPAGTDAGDYVVTAKGKRGGTGSDAGNTVTGRKTLTVAEAGSNVDEAVLVLSPLDGKNNPVPAAGSQKTQSSTGAAGTGSDPILLTLSSLNALGNPSNTPIDVTVTAAGATITHSHTISAAGAYVAETSRRSGDNSLHFTVPAGDGASLVFEISKDTPGEVKVSALIVDPEGSGFDASDEVSLTFTGPAKTISLSDATETLLNQYKDHKEATEEGDKDTDSRDDIALKLTAVDADGNAVVPTKSATVTIAGPDGSMVATDGAGQKIVVGQSVTATTNTITLQVVPSVTAANPLASGEYTVTAKDGARSDKATFTVVGLADSVDLMVSEADENGQREVTVTVLDAADNNVADGTIVVIREADLRGDADQVLYRTSTTGKTKAGVATATFIEIGPGRATIIATADDNGKTAVARVTSTFDAPAAPAPVEADPALASISIEVVGEDHSAGQITVLASLADADGEPVEGMVSFYHSGDANLFGPKDVVTSDGTATAVYDANDDITVLAVSGSHRISLTIPVTSEAEQAAADQAEADRIAADEAAAEAERQRIADEAAAAAAAAEAEAEQAEADRIAAGIQAEIERLTGVSGFTSWLAEGSTTASELFAALSADDATAIHVWNGTAWVRYSVVDGERVPGSVDFDIERGDVLFISN